ncbi:MAG: hypothetical protein H7273_00520 [Polaromonas sp.]|nr:hypothetical protein [Polaromonas sp.]
MTEWVIKMLALIKSGNLAAAVAQIKATTSSKDVRQLHGALDKARLLARLPAVELAINDQLRALASPRLSRSP